MEDDSAPLEKLIIALSWIYKIRETRSSGKEIRSKEVRRQRHLVKSLCQVQGQLHTTRKACPTLTRLERVKSVGCHSGPHLPAMRNDPVNGIRGLPILDVCKLRNMLDRLKEVRSQMRASNFGIAGRMLIGRKLAGECGDFPGLGIKATNEVSQSTGIRISPGAKRPWKSECNISTTVSSPAFHRAAGACDLGRAFLLERLPMAWRSSALEMSKGDWRCHCGSTGGSALSKIWLKYVVMVLSSDALLWSRPSEDLM